MPTRLASLPLPPNNPLLSLQRARVVSTALHEAYSGDSDFPLAALSSRVAGGSIRARICRPE
jgi:hypothetical protein